MATTYSFAMMVMMITMALAKEPVGIRIKDASAVIAFGNPPDIRIRRSPDPKVKTKSTLMVEAQMIHIAGPKKGTKASVALHGDLILNGRNLGKTLMDINKRLIQVAATVNDLADKAKVKGVAKLPVESWKQQGGDNKPAAGQCAKLSVSQCKTTKLPCSWDNGKCMMKKVDLCAKLKADVCEKQKFPCSWDAKAKKCMRKTPADPCAKLGASVCEKQTKLTCSWDKGKCMMKKVDPCAKLKADVCEKQKKFPCAYDAKAKKCMMKKKPADPCAQFKADVCEKQKKVPCAYDAKAKKCVMKKKPDGKGKTTGKPQKGGADKKGPDCKKFGFSKCGKSKDSASCGWDGGECKPKGGGKGKK